MSFGNNTCINIWSICLKVTRAKIFVCINLAAIMFQFSRKTVFQSPRGKITTDNECTRFGDVAGYPAADLYLYIYVYIYIHIYKWVVLYTLVNCLRHISSPIKLLDVDVVDVAAALLFVLFILYILNSDVFILIYLVGPHLRKQNSNVGAYKSGRRPKAAARLL